MLALFQSGVCLGSGFVFCLILLPSLAVLLLFTAAAVAFDVVRFFRRHRPLL